MDCCREDFEEAERIGRADWTAAFANSSTAKSLTKTMSGAYDDRPLKLHLAWTRSLAAVARSAVRSTTATT